MFGNGTCPLPKDESSLLLKAVPITGSLTFQHIILIISIACAASATVVSLWLIFKHLHRYTEPKQQRQVIRIIFTPVVFAVMSTLSIVNYDAAIYLIPLRDLYEAFALASLLLLFTEYVAPDEVTREAYFDNLECHKKRGGMFSFSKKFDVVPGGSLKWFKTKWAAVFIYCIVMILCTIAEEITQATGDYCANSFSPRFANIWIEIVENVSVTAAVTGVLMFYGRLTGEMSEHKPLAKLISFKLIVFVNFIQTIAFSILTGENLLKGTTKVTGKDLTIGIPAVLVAFEQVLFAIGFHYAFRSREYHETEKSTSDTHRMGTFRAAAHAFNPTDLFVGMIGAVTQFARNRGAKGMRGGPGQPPKRVGTYGRVFEQDNVHLEPLTGPGGRNDDDGATYGRYSSSSYPPQAQQDYSYGNGNGGRPNMYQPPPPPSRGPPSYDWVEDPESASLNPAHHERSHSRTSYEGATSVRDVV